MAIVLPVINLNESDNIYTIHTNSHFRGRPSENLIREANN